MTEGWSRFLRQRQALDAHKGELVEVTAFGQSRAYMECGPTTVDYVRLARDAYLRDDLTVEAFERVLDIELGLRDGNLVLIGADGPEWVIRAGAPLPPELQR